MYCASSPASSGGGGGGEVVDGGGGGDGGGALLRRAPVARRRPRHRGGGPGGGGGAGGGEGRGGRRGRWAEAAGRRRRAKAASEAPEVAGQTGAQLLRLDWIQSHVRCIDLPGWSASTSLLRSPATRTIGIVLQGLECNFYFFQRRKLLEIYMKYKPGLLKKKNCLQEEVRLHLF